MPLTYGDMKNMYIIGAQCTGKTTLVNALEDHFINLSNGNSIQRPSIVREVARTVLKEKCYSREDITASPTRALELQQHILAAQYDAETTICAANESSWYICDRSGLDPIVYAKCYVGEDVAAAMLNSEVWRELKSRMKKGLVILCEAGCKWLKDDGVRLIPKNVDEWMRVDAAFRDLLQTQDIAFVILSRDLEGIQQRVDFVHAYY